MLSATRSPQATVPWASPRATNRAQLANLLRTFEGETSYES
jgi:hypothetical protein